MTTEKAAAHYLAAHEHEMENKGYAVFNPKDKAFSDLPIIYGFNNGGSAGWWSAQLIAEDGMGLGGHLCSAEGYMLHDLGILEGTRPDRHENFKEHYPDGYRMEFVGYNDVREHEGITAAIAKNTEQAKAAESKGAQK